ncbi:MAG: hypothetical protein JWO72_359, partial [Caulobacteraceae bacterium]|nr:hypothetical protein [Caulobacteraceae bacterium]
MHDLTVTVAADMEQIFGPPPDAGAGGQLAQPAARQTGIRALRQSPGGRPGIGVIWAALAAGIVGVAVGAILTHDRGDLGQPQLAPLPGVQAPAAVPARTSAAAALIPDPAA